MIETKKSEEYILNGLENNPLFQMSLGSKELYHSNFLAWILGLKRQEEFSIQFFKHLFKEQLSGVEIKSISAPEREKMNIDLIFTLETLDGSSFRIIFENKVKSIAYKEQLIEYHKKIKNNNSKDIYCLLSLATPDFKQEPWLIRSYGDVANSLKYASQYLVKDEGILDTHNLIMAYIEFIQFMDELGKTLVIAKDEKFDYSRNSIRNKLQKLRIHDLYLKYKHQQISSELNKICEGKGLTKISTNLWKEISNCEDNYFTASGFSNSNGLLDFKYVIKSIERKNHIVHVLLGIQVQGQQLRYVVEVGGKGSTKEEKLKSFDIAKTLKEKCLWVTKPNSIASTSVCNDEIKGKARDQNSNHPDYCSYSGCFVYKYSEIKTEASVSDLLSYNSQLIDHILNNKAKIKSIIEEIFSN